MADDSLTRRSGVYEILNTVNGKRYVGSAVHIERRWAEHRRQLLRGEHHNVALQRAWGKYGQEAFSFGVLFNCLRSDLIDFEQHFINQIDPDYNICRVAGSSLGIKHSAETRAKMSARLAGNTHTRGYKHSAESCARMGAGKIGLKYPPRTAEHRARISASKKGKKGQRGRVVSTETRSKLAAANLGKRQSPDIVQKRASLQPDQVREVRALRKSGMAYRDIAARCGIREQMVVRICLRQRYDWIDLGEPAIRLPRKGRGWSDEARARHPKKEKPTSNPDARRRPKSEEHRRKISQTLMGHSYNKGIPKSAEHRANLSVAKLGVPNLKLRGRKNALGHKQSPEHIAKKSAALILAWARRKAKSAQT